MIGKYFFNSSDAYITYGILFEKGSYGELLKFPGAWPSEDRQVSLPLIMLGKDESEFWTRYNAFRTLITAGAEFTFLAKDLHRRFKFAYESMSSFTTITKMRGLNKVGCSFTLVLTDDYPDVYTYVRTATFTKNNSPAGYTGSQVSFSRSYTSFSLVDATALGGADATFNADGQAFANKYGTNIPL